MDENDLGMMPKDGDSTIAIPAAFEYRGGRSEGMKNSIILGICSVFIPIVFTVMIWISDDLLIWHKIVYSIGVLYLGLWVLRYIVLDELYYSSIFEKLKKEDYSIDYDNFWQIFDIDYEAPYICYFKNGSKGVFVRMVRDTITGKPDSSQDDHNNAISEAYRLAHTYKLDIVHIDYMDTVGNDLRLKSMIDGLDGVENPDLQMLLASLYQHLEEEMSRQYTTSDVYLFLSRSSVDNLFCGVLDIVDAMLGGNFITYKVLKRDEIGTLPKAIFNFENFSVVSAMESLLSSSSSSGIIPIRVRHEDGLDEILNKTQSELRQEYEDNLRQRRSNKRHRKSSKITNSVDEFISNSVDEEIDLFGDD